MLDSKNHALVVGASGVIGWSIVNQLLQPYPSPSPFGRITAFVNRPMELKDSFWPEHTLDRPELRLVTGIDLFCSDEEFEGIIKEIPNVESISHVYYFGTTALDLE
jgi:nucleoside-diphosphate-sugar epimerase